MAFISELTGRPVTDIDGKRIGVLKDVVARPREGVSHPVVNAIIVGGAAGTAPSPISISQRCSLRRSRCGDRSRNCALRFPG